MQLRMSQNQPEPTPEASQPPHQENHSLPESSENSEPSHFDSLIENAGAEEIAASTAPPPGILSEDDFHKVFCTGFNIASKMSGLKSLEVNETDGAARGASHALYETISDIPALHFILQPGGKWGQRALLIGAFAVPMALSVRAEIAGRHAQTVAPSAPVVDIGAAMSGFPE